MNIGEQFSKKLCGWKNIVFELLLAIEDFALVCKFGTETEIVSAMQAFVLKNFSLFKGT